MRTYGQKDRHDEANSRFTQFTNGPKKVYFRCIIISRIILEFLPLCIIHINGSPSTDPLLYLATSICYFNPLFHRACEQSAE